VRPSSALAAPAAPAARVCTLRARVTLTINYLISNIIYLISNIIYLISNIIYWRQAMLADEVREWPGKLDALLAGSAGAGACSALGPRAPAGIVLSRRQRALLGLARALLAVPPAPPPLQPPPPPVLIGHASSHPPY
jgi:hypothetical protein